MATRLAEQARAPKELVSRLTRLRFFFSHDAATMMVRASGAADNETAAKTNNRETKAATAAMVKLAEASSRTPKKQVS
jgi:hypothetical protein